MKNAEEIIIEINKHFNSVSSNKKWEYHVGTSRLQEHKVKAEFNLPENFIWIETGEKDYENVSMTTADSVIEYFSRQGQFTCHGLVNRTNIVFAFTSSVRHQAARLASRFHSNRNFDDDNSEKNYFKKKYPKNTNDKDIETLYNLILTPPKDNWFYGLGFNRKSYCQSVYKLIKLLEA